MKKLILLFVLFFSAVLYSQSYQPYMTVLGFPDAWNITIGDEDVIIALLGNGIHTNHELLQHCIYENPGEIPGNEIDDDGNGFIDDVNGWNFYSHNNNITETRLDDYQFSYSHETGIAGILSATSTLHNNYLVGGLAPGCKIMPVKFYEPTDPNDPLKAQKLANSLNYVRDRQLQYPNKKFLIILSYTFNGLNQTQKDLVMDAIQNCYNAGIPVFCGAGNNTGQPVEFPANLTITFAITCVRGANFNYVFPQFYPTGDGLDLAAPEDIYHTTYANSGYQSFGQTSGAAPQACAIAALILSIQPEFPLEELRRVLHRNTFKNILDGTTGNPVTYNEDGYNNKVGYGRVNALNSLTNHSIVFLNNVEGNTSVGQLIVEGQTLNSGDDLLFFRGEEVNVIAYDGTYNYNNLENKFYNWNFWDPEYLTGRERENYFFSDQLLDAELDNTTAFFKKTTPLTVRNYFEGGNGGIILFGESTLPGDVINRVSPFTENAFINNPPQVVATYRAEAEPTHNLFNTTWNFRSWENGSTTLWREAQITQTNPIEWRANYKGIQKSDNPNAFSNNSQRKFVRTNNGILYNVYESLGYVWLEKSTDGGNSWTILNNGNPLGNTEAISPSIGIKKLNTYKFSQ